MRKILFLFDMDGTTNESGPGIKKSVATALERQGITEYTDEQLDLFVGPPLRQSFKTQFGLTDEQATQGIRDYRSYYEVKGKFENRMYPGIPELLAKMKQAGLLCGIASSKPEKFVVEILEYYGVAQYFDVVAGATMSEQLVEKPDIIRLALRRAEEQGLIENAAAAADQVNPDAAIRARTSLDQTEEKTVSKAAADSFSEEKDVSKAGSSNFSEEVNGSQDQTETFPAVWMVGDRSYDVTGAHECGLPVIGVTYGYGSRQELEEAGADVITDTVTDLETAIFSIAEQI